MPLLDHFRPPLSERRPWESFRATWIGALADLLNQGGLPPGLIALERVSAGAGIDIDGGDSVEVMTPAASAPLVLPAAFPERAAVEIHAADGGRTLVAAVELVSPGNKDRDTKRRLFAAKCAACLARGAGLVVVDVVTSRQANLHNELVGLLGLDAGFRMAGGGLYAAAYRPLRRDGAEVIDAWPMSLTVGRALPTVPLSLAAELCLPLDLEASYAEACRRRRVDEVAVGA